MRRFQINEKIGSYTIDAFLGAGGMGEVYRGVQTNINRTAAIKVLKNLRNNESVTKRFYNEARVQSNLNHPNIAALYDFQEIGGQLCIFMEYVDGESLDNLIERRFFAVEDALRTFQTICEAVAFTHRNGIVHRDIKSQNIKLDSKGAIKLLDFGIAKDSESVKLTKTGGVIGTPNYISPEQLAGETADFQTDVWSLGILFYEMLTGVQPFKSENPVELYRKIENGEFAPIEKTNPAVPKDVAALVARCLNKDKNARYRDAGETALSARQILQSRYGYAGVESSGNGNQYSSAPNEKYFDEKSLAPTKQKSWLLPIFIGTVAAVLAVFVIAGFAFWAMSGDENILKNSNAAANRNILVIKENDPKNVKKKPLIQTSGETTEIKIDVIEGSAEFILDGTVSGKTPYTLRGKIGEKVDVKLRREGFKDFETQIEISNGKKYYTFVMKKN